jgi:SAM-dependent methyltransferase
VIAQMPANQDVASHAPDPCLVCGSQTKEMLYSPTYDKSVYEASNYFLANRTATAHGMIVRCRECHFVFTSPRFSDRDYDRIYSGIKPPADLDPAFERAKISRFKRLAAIVRKYEPREAPFLDFGCGDGGFLRQFDSAAGRGFEVGGSGRLTAGKSEIVTGDWAEVARFPEFGLSKFDFAVAFDVLEHLPRIERDLDLIRAVIKPGGMFFATVPNVESLVARAMGKRWNMLLLEHLWYFSPRTLGRLMARHGFDAVRFSPFSFDAPIAHLATRIAQTFGMKGTFKVGSMSRAILPVPAGIMLGVFRKRAP